MKRFSLLVLVLISSGCMHAASVKQDKQAAKQELSPAVVSAAVVKGKTTRDELVARLGVPNSVEKHPYHVPKITAPGFKLEVPPAMMAVETWNYWKIFSSQPGGETDRALMVKIYIDEDGKALDYEFSEKRM